MVSRILVIAALSSIWALLGLDPVQADTLFFKNGMRLDVESAWHEGGQVKCRMLGDVYSYGAEEISRIEKTAAGPKETSEPEGRPETPGNQHIASSRHTTDFDTREDGTEIRRLVENGEWEKAIQLGRRDIDGTHDSDSAKRRLAWVHNEYARVLTARRELEAAADQLLKALRYEPGNSVLNKSLAGLYLTMAGQAFQHREFDAAEGYLEKARQADSDNPYIYLLRGRIAYGRNRYENAESYWSTALRLKPDLAEARQWLERLARDRKTERGLSEREAGDFVLKFQGAENQSVAEQTLAILQEAYLDVGEDLGVYPQETITVIIYPKSDPSGSAYMPDWAAGVYDGKIRIGEDLFFGHPYLKPVLYHEYTHALVHILGGRGIPLWLNEGLAEYEAAASKPEGALGRRKKILQAAARGNRLIPLKTMARMNVAALSRLPRKAIGRVYAQAESFVTFLIERYGLFDVKTVITDVGAGVAVEEAVRNQMNSELGELEKDWREWLRGSG